MQLLALLQSCLQIGFHARGGMLKKGNLHSEPFCSFSYLIQKVLVGIRGEEPGK